MVRPPSPGSCSVPPATPTWSAPPGIYGSSAAFLASKQLGHSVTIAENHYQGVRRGIPKDAHTLEAAMQIEDLMRQVIEAVRSRRKEAAKAWSATTAGSRAV